MVPPSALTSTRSIGAQPDHARPVSVTGPGGTKRVLVMKSGMPGGTISERGMILVTGRPGSSSELLR